MENPSAPSEQFLAPQLLSRGIGESQIMCSVWQASKICGVSAGRFEEAVQSGAIKPDVWTSTGRPLFSLTRVDGEIFALFNPNHPAVVKP